MTATLHTRRLVLRPFHPGDLDKFADLMANPGFMRFSTGLYSREQTSAFLEKVLGWDESGIPSLFAVVFGQSGDVLGYCGFYHPDGFEEVEIGYRLHPDYWNKGFATEAARAVRDHGFSAWNLNRMISLIHPENVASRRVAEKTGMRLERQTTFKGFPTQVFALSREQWLALHDA